MPMLDGGIPAARLNSLTSLRFFAAEVVVLVHLSAVFDLP